MNRKNFIRTLAIISSIVILLLLAILFVVFKVDVILSLIVSLVFITILLIIFYSLDTIDNENNKRIESSLDESTLSALKLGNIGILIYSEDYEITWLSSFFLERHLNYLGEKILSSFPELQELLNGELNKKMIIINDDKYDVSRINNNVLIFKDISREYDLNILLKENSLVLGLINFDNYNESEVTEDEITYINTNIKNPVIDYFKKCGCIYKTLKNQKMLLVLNESIYEQIKEDRFSILTSIRKVSSSANLDVTLSMAFASGSKDLNELDEMVEYLLELAVSRGGDQVVCQKYGEDVRFFGGSSEAREKLNKTKVRVTINALKDLINKADKVIIVGHKDADADCIGASICLSCIVQTLQKNVYIVSKSHGIEPMINDVLELYANELNHKHNFIDEETALNLVDEKSLVIMVDHHNKAQSNAPSILDKSARLVIIDHHRRSADLDVSPLMFYIEASASSSCELVSEFIPYVSHKFEMSEIEANIIYLGILIDTDHFRVRTGVRTFEVLKQLRQLGAQPLECDKMASESYQMLADKAHLISIVESYRQDVLISCALDAYYNRSLASKTADELVKAKGIEAVFVICQTNSDEIIITARSAGRVNVQVILEKMGGGGHMTAAGVQIKGNDIKEIKEELLKQLDEYFMEV